VTIEASLPEPISADARDLPAAVAAALAAPAPGTELRIDAAGYRWFAWTWGDPANPPLVLVHGVTSDADTFWRIAPALAASGRRVVAVDLPGHGRTTGWTGRHHFADTAVDLVAFLAAAAADGPELAILGHSWGAMVVAQLPAAGLRPARLILLDPPVMAKAEFEALAADPEEQPMPDVETALGQLRRAHPEWTEGDVLAKAAGLLRFTPRAALAVVLRNGDWDAGVAGLSAPASAGVSRWVIRGERAAGSYIPETFVPRLAAAVGPDHVLTIRAGAHSPQRMHPEATIVAILRALTG